jgi:hypothetical protein
MAVLHSLPTQMWETKPLSHSATLKGDSRRIPGSVLLMPVKYQPGIRKIVFWDSFFKVPTGQPGNADYFPECWIKNDHSGLFMQGFLQEFTSMPGN